MESPTKTITGKSKNGTREVSKAGSAHASPRWRREDEE